MNLPAERRYHVAHRGRKFGPFTLVQLTARNLDEDMLVWCEGSPEWRPITEVEELRGYVRRATTIRTTAPPASLGNGPGRMSGSPDTLASESVATEDPMLPPLPQDALSTAGQPLSTTVKTIGILSIVSGTLGLVCGPISIACCFFVVPLGPPAMVDALHEPRVIAIYLAFSSICLVLSALNLLAGGGLVKGRSWGRKAAMGVSISYVVLGIVSYCFFIGYLLAIQPAESEDFGATGAVTTGIIIGGVICGFIGTLYFFVYNAVILILLNRKSVKESLA